ncbi:acetyl-CoA synthetase [Pseudonocardia ammonioxydans]|uniref:Acetyl-CoA synthetase n=1 Tax=Pseudonocardia ammonioxydans TaxID=260086 RepID=A0A1I4SFS0_PSUAM|nr:AMP-binding protein [Pseudonocardia ammonioxydans]SFM63161.1 acetyl-CoA synthetase [Pseudonocardia ammonioxydans]
MSSVHEIYRDARDRLVALHGDHDKAVADFEWPVLHGAFQWAHDWFDVIADGESRTALHIVEEDGGEGSWTFDELRRRSNRVARWLASHGVRRGDAVLVMLGNRVELWESVLAVMKLGAVIMPTTTALGAVDLPDRLERGGARFVIADVSCAEKFDGLLDGVTAVSVGGRHEGWLDWHDADAVDDAPVEHPGTTADDRLLLYFTSGTTSRPKLVEHTQASYPVGHLSTMYWLGLVPGDVHLNISSPGWAKHAWSCFFAPWIAGATIFVYNYARFDAGALLGQIRGKAVTTFCAPPTVWRMLIKADLSGGPGSLREVIAAGEPLNPEIIEQVQRQWGLTLRDGFGQTETTAQVGNTPGSVVKPGSMGRPLPGVPVVLVDETTGAVSETEGEICIDLSRRPVALMTGYLDTPEKTAEAMAGGFYHTGDTATRDADGYLFYVGRTDDVFKASDYKVSPFELESVLVEHPAVLEAAVVPQPDPVRLAVPKAYVALAPGHEPDRDTALAILRHARENLAPYLRVRRLEFAELPKTISGKIRRVELRARERDDAAAAAATEWRDDAFPELRG